MANTYTLIASSTVGAGGAASIEFTSIPSTYTDLLIKLSLRSDISNLVDDLKITFNNSTSTYTLIYIQGNGTTASSGTKSGVAYLYDVNGINGTTSTSNMFSNVDIYIPNYASANQKSISIDRVLENNATTAYAGMSAGLWSGTSAINSIQIYSQSNSTIAQYSTAYLYGIKNS